MYVWELVSCRLRVDGWDVWHSSRNDAYGPTFTVHVRRPGQSYEVSGPTLTEAYAAAARRVRDETIGTNTGVGPHFALAAVFARS